MNRLYLKYANIPVLGPGLALIGTRYSTLPVPTYPYPGYTPPLPPVLLVSDVRTASGDWFMAWALIRRPTHLPGTLVAHLRYDRGI